MADLVNPSYDIINKAKHYNSLGAECSNCGHPIECIDVVMHMDFLTGSIFKYGWRADHKGENLKDLLKQQYYVNKLVDKTEKAIAKAKKRLEEDRLKKEQAEEELKKATESFVDKPINAPFEYGTTYA